MSLYEQAYSFLNCTYCGNFFGRNEMVFCCGNHWHHDCFDYEAVCKMCIDDHVDSTHATDKQDRTEIIEHRYDIMYKKRVFIRAMVKHFSDKTIGRVMPKAEASKAKPAVRQLPVEILAQKREDERMVKLGDFPLELIEEIVRYLDPKDVMNLMMTNKRLYSFYSNNQSIVFEEHVCKMNLDEHYIYIMKFPNSYSWDIDVSGDLQSINRIHSCEKFELQTDDWYSQKIKARHESILRQLKSVNELEFEGGEEILKQFLANFRASVKKSAKLSLWGIEELREEQLGDFIETQLSECEKVSLVFGHVNIFHVCYNSLSKTQIKLIEIESEFFAIERVQWHVERIVKDGIPSQNPHASFLGRFESCVIPAETIAFLTNYPGIQQIHGDDRLPLFEELKKLCGPPFFDTCLHWSESEMISFLIEYSEMKNVDGENCEFLLELSKKLWKDALFDEEIWCFRRRIDSMRDCVYILYSRLEPELSHFFAFYMPPQ